MKIKVLIALVLLASLLACGCAGKEGADATTQAAVPSEKVALLRNRTPANDETVTLINGELADFLRGHALGKGLSAAQTRQQDAALPEPVVLSWECDEENTGYTVVYGMKQDLSDGIAVETANPQVKLEDLFVASTYYWKVVIHTAQGDKESSVISFKTAETPRLISIEGVTNTRDVGGYLTVDGQHRFKQGMVYRGARLNDLITDKGIQKALEVYRIKTDFDLRRKTDNGYSDISPLGRDYVNISVIDYTGAFSHQEEMREAIALCAKEEIYPIYVHCSAGRDRTGTMLFILGALVGVPEDKLYADYEITYLSKNSYASGDLLGHESFLKFMDQFNQCEGNTVNEKAENYCKSIGVTDEEIAAIRQILLEEVK